MKLTLTIDGIGRPSDIRSLGDVLAAIEASINDYGTTHDGTTAHVQGGERALIGDTAGVTIGRWEITDYAL